MKIWRSLAGLAAVAAIAGTAHSMRNLTILKDPRRAPESMAKPRVSILCPARNEAKRISPTIQSVLHQTYSDIEFLILDDASTDATSQVVMNLINGHPYARLMTSNSEPPTHWLGKPWACHRLAHEATGDVLLFIDADVELTPDAVERMVDLFTQHQLDVMCPYPQQTTHTFLQELVQPLLQWSWLTTLPLDVAETSPRPSLTAGNGQLLMVTRSMYEKIGGHECVKDEVLEDINLVRHVKANGGKGGVVDGSSIARCSMYESDIEMIDGYSKSLWKAFGSPVAGIAVNTILFVVYVLPVLLIFSPDRSTRFRAALAWLSASVGRWLIAQRLRQGSPLFSLLHPLSVAMLNLLTVRSISSYRNSAIAWKGRPL